MSADNFSRSLGLVLQHEGGLVDDPRDPGGRTNRGVTQRTYDDWREDQGLPKRDVKFINDYETGKIYRADYWDVCRCDDLPSGVDYCVFDMAVNSGRDRAARYLQRALGLIEDGHVGPQTIAAARQSNAPALIDRYCAQRIDFLKHLSTFDRFGRGWCSRVEEVAAQAKDMAL